MTTIGTKDDLKKFKIYVDKAQSDFTVGGRRCKYNLVKSDSCVVLSMGITSCFGVLYFEF